MNKVTLYGSAGCSYCRRAEDLLTRKGVAFDKISVDQQDGELEKMIARSGGRRSVPQIFIGERHVGGYDDLALLERKGELDALLGLPVASP